MTNLPDFSAMSEAEKVEWLANNDTSELLALASRARGRWVQVDAHGHEVMQTTAFRLPPSMIAEIDRAHLDQLRRRGPEAG